MKVKVGDNVKILSGDHKGSSGKILKIDRNVYKYVSKNTKFLILDKKNSIKNLIWQNF